MARGSRTVLGRVIGVIACLFTSIATLSGGVRAHAAGQDRPIDSPTDVARRLLTQKQVVTIPAEKKKTRRAIEKSEPTFLLSSGESRVILFELPIASRRSQLRVTSLCNCDGPAKSVFVPEGAVLDGMLGVIRTLDTERLTFKSQALETTIDLVDANNRDRYLLVYTDGEKVGAQLGSLRTFEGLLMKLSFPYFRAGHGTIEFEISAPKK